MFINEKGKLFGKISIIDIVVVIGIAIAVWGLYAKYTAPAAKEIATEDQTIEYTVKVKGVRQGTVDALTRSKAVTNSLT